MSRAELLGQDILPDSSDFDLDEHERQQLESLAEKIQNALFELHGPRDTENIAQLLELYADKVREGEI